MSDHTPTSAARGNPAVYYVDGVCMFVMLLSRISSNPIHGNSVGGNRILYEYTCIHARIALGEGAGMPGGMPGGGGDAQGVPCYQR